MKSILAISFSLSVLLISSTSFCQKKLTILGSSTAYGNGASVVDSSWVGRLRASFNKNSSDGVDTTIDNRAVPGYVTYQSLPTDYPTPPNRPSPDPSANITYVLNSIPRPDIVIISYPTNDILNGYDPKEMMDNLRFMYKSLDTNGIICFIATSQPRNTASDAQRTILQQLVDSIQNTFGFHSINFWNDLVTTDGTNMLRPEVNADGTHPNNLGHRLLFEKVQQKNIFGITGGSLPVVIQNWQAGLQGSVVLLSWHSYKEEDQNVFEIQRSLDGREFQTLQKLNAAGHDADYSWTDVHPAKGKNFYRLKIIAPGQITYTRVIPVLNDQQQLITRFFNDGSRLHLQVNCQQNQQVVLSIINASGSLVKKQSYPGAAITNVTIPITELSSGNYFLRVVTSDGASAIERFAKLK